MQITKENENNNNYIALKNHSLMHYLFINRYDSGCSHFYMDRTYFSVIHHA